MNEDQALIDRFLAGEPEAAATVEDWVRAAAFPFRLSLPSEWEDGVQESVVRVLEQLQAGRFEGRSSLKTYVWRLTTYRFTDRLRQRRRRPQVELEEVRLEDEKPDPQDLTLRREKFRLAAQVMERSPAACQELWRLLLEGLSYRQMGERLAVREGTLRVRVLRCRNKAVELRAAITAESSTGADL